MDKASKVKLYHQLYLVFANAIAKKELPEGTKLPSIRTLSETYAISRNTVTKAYSELQANGYVYSLSKSGFFAKNPSEENCKEPNIPIDHTEKNSEIPTVDSILKEHLKETPKKEIPAFLETAEESRPIKKPELFIMKDPFSFGSNSEEEQTPSFQSDEPAAERHGNSSSRAPQADEKETPVEAFVASALTAIREHKTILTEKNNADPMGEQSLRNAIASFLYAFHHVDADESQIIISSNKENLLFKLLMLDEFKKGTELHGLLQLAEKSIGHSQKEREPSISIVSLNGSSLHDVFRIAGFSVNDVSVNSQKHLAAALEEAKSSVAFIYSNDFGFGQEKRIQSLIDWLQKDEDRYVIEYDTATQPGETKSIYSMKKDKCIYLLNFSHLISKSVSAAIAVLPPRLIESYRKRYTCLGSPLSMLSQITLADFLKKGKLTEYLSSIEQL